MRILVVQTAFIGDVVLTAPFLRALLEKWPGCAIDVVAIPQGCAVLEGFPSLRCHALDKRSGLKGIRDVLRSLAAGHEADEFDLVFCVHRSLRSLWIGRRARAKKRIAFRSAVARMLGYKTVPYPPYSEEIHYADKPMALLLALDSNTPLTLRPTLAVAAADEASAKLKIAPLGPERRYIVLSPFSVWNTKMWFADRFARVCAEIAAHRDVAVVVTGGGAGRERAIGQTIVEKIERAGGLAVSLVGATTIGELKALIRGAALVLANDSAPVHIASAFDVPTVAIFGPTVKKWGFFPLSSRHIVIERPGVPCRPCGLHGPMKCPKRHFRCMNEIQVEDVRRAVKNLLESGPARK
ncbi:MAG: glycosyltransferase family 9 protein [Deltaproteobacteria bacterium]|nr:glycosyltransferase family 9 protein [Deltaproteobacteria bacterium]